MKKLLFLRQCYERYAEAYHQPSVVNTFATCSRAAVEDECVTAFRAVGLLAVLDIPRQKIASSVDIFEQYDDEEDTATGQAEAHWSSCQTSRFEGGGMNAY